MEQSTFDIATLRKMQSLSQAVCRLDPRHLNAEATPGELAWSWAKDYDTLSYSWHPCLWEEDDQVLAWAWLKSPFNVKRSDGKMRTSNQARLVWQSWPNRPDLVAKVFDWFVENARHSEMATILLASDEQARALAESRGFALDAEYAADDGYWTQLNMRTLSDFPVPQLPDRYRFVTAQQVTPDEAVKVHQAAWGSSIFTTASLARMEKTWPYRKDLHVFVQADSGKLAASAVVWFDETSKAAEFEPVGTHPDHRREGLGRALQLFGMQKAKEAGAGLMLVACLGGAAHPAARRMYRDVGFREISRDYPMIKQAVRS